MCVFVFVFANLFLEMQAQFLGGDSWPHRCVFVLEIVFLLVFVCVCLFVFVFAKLFLEMQAQFLGGNSWPRR